MPHDHTAWKDPNIAQNYLEGVRAAIPLAGEQIDVILRLVEACERPVTTILDLGCGDGVLGGALLERYPDAEGIFMDFSKTMLEGARRKVGSAHDSAVFIEYDYSDPAWVERVESHAPYDVVVSGFSIHHQPDVRKKEIYGEIFELLGQGGIFINLEHVASHTRWAEHIFEERFIDALYAAERHDGGARSREEIARTHYHRDDKEANILAPVDAQCDWLREIGYVEVDCYFKLYELALFAGRKP